MVFVVYPVLSVSTITEINYQDIKSIFGVNIYHVPGLCLLGFMCPPPPPISLIPYFHVFNFLLAEGGFQLMSEYCLILGLYSMLKSE